MQPEQIVLGGNGGIRVGLTDYGASIMSVTVPSPTGATDVVLGYATAADYVGEPYYMGSTCGRYAGRIDRGQFELLGKRIVLHQSGEEGTPVLHGGHRDSAPSSGVSNRVKMMV